MKIPRIPRALVAFCAALVPLLTVQAGPLPSGWSDQDIGSVSLAGSATYDAPSSVYTVKGSGNDIFGTADAFHYAYQPVTGDFTFVARILGAGGTGVNGGAASGIMLRETLTAGSRHQMIYLEPGGYARSVFRLTTGGATSRFAITLLSYPRWLKLQRYGEQITVAYSSDGVNWIAGPGQTLRTLAATVYVGLGVTARTNAVLNTATFDNVSLSPLVIETTTSWLGNTYSGGSRYVQNRARAIAVDPVAGSVLLNGESESYGSTFYDAQGNFIACAANSHFNGTNAVVWDPVGNYVWLSQAPYNGSTGKGGVGYYKLDGTYVGAILNTATSGRNIVGLAVYNGELYAVDDANVSNPADTTQVTVHVFSLATRTATRTFLVPSLARNLAADSSGNLWIVFTKDATHSPVVRRYTNTGTLLAQQITGLGDPQGIAIDSAGKIYVADSGVNQRVEIYDLTGAQVGSFGDQYGVYSGTKGLVGPGKLDFPTGVAVDNAGNLYVACNGPGNQWSGGGSGLVLRKYSSKTTASGTTLVWERLGLEYVDCAAADPATDGADVYTKYHHYVMDYSKPAGQGWTYKGQTLDPFTYPNDPRLKSERAGVWLRALGAKKFLIDNDQQGGQINFYRFQTGSEIVVPHATFTRETARGQPSNALSIWTDQNANGQVDAGETDLAGQALGSPSGETYAWHVDANGDVWTIGGGNNKIGGVQQPTKIWRFIRTTDANGNPAYSSSNNEQFALPSEFSGAGTYVLRLHYEPSTDTMYVGGYTTALPRPDSRWGLVGRELIRYNNWRGVSAARSLAWRITLPYSATDGTRSFDIGGDIIASVCWGSHVVSLHDTATGALLDELQPGPEVNGLSGNIDTHHAISVHRRANGEYLIFVEEDNEHKVLLYRWNSWRTSDIGAVGLPGSASWNSSTGVFTLAGSGLDIWNTADGFRYVYRGMTGDGQIVARLNSITGSGWQKAGVMIRESLAPGSRFADIVGSPNNNLSFQWRAATGGAAGGQSIAGLPPRWFRMVRAGNVFTASYSANGTTWTQLGTPQTIAMGATVYVGLPVTSHDNHATATAVIDNVVTTP